MLPVWTKSKLFRPWWLPLETATLAGGECKELFSASGRYSHVMKLPYKFEMKRVRVEPPITKHTPMTKHWPISYLFLLHFEWSSWLWVSSGDLQYLFELWRQRSDQEEAWKGCNVQFKKHETPYFQTLTSSSFLVLMIQKIWVHQLELYKTSLNSKGDIIMSKTFWLQITNYFKTPIIEH
jgi:hypothetical protein